MMYAQFKTLLSLSTPIYIYIYIYIYCYVSSFVSGRYSRYFDIPCPGHVGEEIRKRTKICNSSCLPELALKGYFMANNDNNNKRVSTTG